ncbi:15050_t:CDS:2, partial [Cetraspora pellucida]
VPIHRGAQHILPSIKLAEKQTNTPSISSSSSILSTSSIFNFIQMKLNTLIVEHVVIKSCLDESDDNDSDLHDPDISSDNENPMSPIDDNILENELTHSNFKQKNKETKTKMQICRKNLMHDMQLQMFTIIQEMQTKINKLYVNLKISSENNIEKEL